MAVKIIMDVVKITIQKIWTLHNNKTMNSFILPTIISQYNIKKLTKISTTKIKIILKMLLFNLVMKQTTKKIHKLPIFHLKIH